MKQIFLSVTALLSLVIYANAQNSSPYWSLAGNSNASSSSKLGTTSSTDLKLYTNNSERMRISSSGDVGIGTTSFSAKMMINSSSSENPLKVQVNGSSKLFVSSNGGVSIGSSSTPPPNGLDISGDVGIGTTSPSAKLHVVNNSGNGIYSYAQNYGLQAYASSSSGYGVSASSNYIGVYGHGSSYGVYAVGSNGTGLYAIGTSYGVNGYSSSSTGVYGDGNFGIYGRGTNTGVYGVGSSYGLSGYSSGIAVNGYSSSSYGGFFQSNSNNALWAVTSSSASNVYAGVFQGNVYTYNSYVTSDKNLKKNIQDFGEAMSIINKLKPKNYEFRNDDKYASLQLPKGNHYGLLAQDVEQILPNLVRDAPLMINSKANNGLIKQAVNPEATAATQQQEASEIINTKAVNYTELIPIVIKGMQELSKENQDLKNEVNQLKTLVQNLTVQNGNSSFHSSAFIKQNMPNPSKDYTVISYFTPENTKKAQILITDMKGSVLKAYDVSRGEGQLHIKNGELPTGTYNYTLYVNSNKIDTKQMIIMK